MRSRSPSRKSTDCYGLDLLLRVQGYAEGPAVLALWRRFAWTPQGSPRPKFRLSDKMILQAERQLVAAFLALPK
ncbi:hypothetical protein [Blastopirellula retiformator]|uniref:Uncharacterized protein n=1 Tax=Blastopirellula retiformator TaxID=2527970 RepID=A0A5C5VA36_9BACT|nr:hypothetical protein [Blastopirellula retiformator]TWT34759.1 hypothetical protein Enr8_21730 [Blastopirellula retiformator]